MGAVEVTVDEDADASISPGFAAGFIDEVEFEVAGFLSDERVGAGGRITGDPERRWDFS
jgi:hypothetical protein